MEWKKPKEGDKREKTRFLFFPKSINGRIRWLETATWVELCVEVWDGEYIEYQWVDLRWKDEK